ncbi:MAG: hypothetical protein ABIK28_01000 [Planctomycetota bacterium]
MHEDMIKDAVRKTNKIPFVLASVFFVLLHVFHRYVLNEPGVPPILTFVLAVGTSLYLFEKTLIHLFATKGKAEAD